MESKLQMTGDLHAVLTIARDEAQKRHNIYLDIEHLLLGLVKHPGGSARALLDQYSVDTDVIYAQVADAVGMERSTTIDLKGTSKIALSALDRAKQEAGALGHAAVDSGHLLISLLHEQNGAVHEALSDLPFNTDDARTFMRSQAPAAMQQSGNRPLIVSSQRQSSPTNNRDEFILVPTRAARKPKPESTSTGVPTWLVIVGGVILLLIYMWRVLSPDVMLTVTIVIGGWIFSVTLHEFGHALVAYIGGDHTVRDKGYLTFNPLKYTHPLLSIIMPLIFLALGGIGLPGGAVYIERHRLKNKWWGAAVSAAGPLANLMLAVLLAIPFLFGLVNTAEAERMDDFEDNKDRLLQVYPTYTEESLRDVLEIPDPTIWNNSAVWSAVAFLILLQFTAVFFNLIPIPPLDGFGIIEPYLGPQIKLQLRQLGMMGIFLIFFLFLYVTPVQVAFWNSVFDATDSVSVPGWMVADGYDNFMFWRSD